MGRFLAASVSRTPLEVTLLLNASSVVGHSDGMRYGQIALRKEKAMPRTGLGLAQGIEAGDDAIT